MYKTGNYKLIPITSNDLKKIDTHYYAAIEDISLNKYTDRCRYPLTEKQCDEFIDNNFIFGIFDMNNDHIGNIGIHNIDHLNRTCEVGIFIWLQGKGVGSECLPVVVDHCINRLNMQRVWMGTLSINDAMNKLAIKSGFELEGVQKRARILNNEYVDVNIYVKFND